MSGQGQFQLREPPFYVPFRHGRYDVAPGLVKFGKGDGDADRKVFQFDRTFADFRRTKFASRAYDMAEFYACADFSVEARAEVVGFVLDRLVREHAELFRAETGRAGTRLHCALTSETLTFDRGRRLVIESGPAGYVDALDALACQVQEDLAVVSVAEGRHWLSAAHVCLPNGWSPREKVGGSFASIHEPVAGMAEMNRRGDEFARVMVAAVDGLVRFAWGVTFDDELNHHPDVPRAAFDPAAPRAFVRVERQTIWGLPGVGAALFTIRTYVYDAALFRSDPALRDALGRPLRSMSAESRRYKGLDDRFDDLVAWIDRGN